MIQIGKKLIFSLVVLIAFLGLFEFVSYLIDSDVQRAPVVVERVMHQDIRYDWLEEDPVLFWKLKGERPGQIVFRTEQISQEAAGPDPDTLVTDSGFTNGNRKSLQTQRLSAAFDRYVIQPVKMERSPGIMRLICLGDSCTFFGHPSYPKTLEVLLSQTASNETWEVINAGVPAYSSYQGMKLLETHMMDFRPDVVTVFFGWNDHWLAAEMPDRHYDLMSESKAGGKNAIRELGFFRVMQAGMDRIRPRLRDVKGNRDMRVSLQDYRKNLLSMIATARSVHAEPVLITAPHGFDSAHPPEYLREVGFFTELHALIDTHESYNTVVRETARETHTMLVDPASRIAAMPDRRELFLKDGIHFSQSGIRVMASIIYNRLTEHLPGKGQQR